jgi:hypothetical protein
MTRKKPKEPKNPKKHLTIKEQLIKGTEYREGIYYTIDVAPPEKNFRWDY